MKNFFTLLSTTVVLFTACNQNKPTQNTATSPDNTAKTIKECYLATSGKDSATISFDNTNGEVTGKLAFNFFEKDDSNGDIKGSFIGDTLLVDYVFMAEGRTSKNPMIFLKSGNELKQGYGEITTYLGKTYFTDRSKVNFETGFLFKPVDCK